MYTFEVQIEQILSDFLLCNNISGLLRFHKRIEQLGFKKYCCFVCLCDSGGVNEKT